MINEKFFENGDNSGNSIVRDIVSGGVWDFVKYVKQNIGNILIIIFGIIEMISEYLCICLLDSKWLEIIKGMVSNFIKEMEWQGLAQVIGKIGVFTLILILWVLSNKVQHLCPYLHA